MNNWTWFFTWPIAMLASTFDVFAQMLRGWQAMGVSGLNTTMSGMQAMPGMQAWPPQGGNDGDAPSGRERCAMTNRDTDLTGDDRLKLVRYKIVFLKRDLEIAFPEKEELVAYDTSPADWAGIKVAHFMAELREWSEADRDRLAARWKTKSYPAKDATTGKFSIPADDERYIKVYFEVLQRWDRMEADYEKRRTEALEEIRDAIAGQSTRPF